MKKSSKKNSKPLKRNIASYLAQIRTKINQTTEKYQSTLNSLDREKREQKRLTQEIADIEAAQSLVNAVAQEAQQTVHRHVSAVVSSCLRKVFPEEPYEFEIRFEKKRGKTVARMVFVRGDLVVDPLDASGGGVVDIAAFALRLACILISRPQLRKFIVMDEPFRHLHRSVRPTALKLMYTLAQETGTQFVISSHLLPEKQLRKLGYGKVIKIH